MISLRRSPTLLAAAALAFAVAASTLLARDGLIDLLWADRSVRGDLASVEHVDIDAGVVFSVWPEASPSTGSVLRAHDNKTGTPIWETRVPESVTGLVSPRDSLITTGTRDRNARTAQITRRFDAGDGGQVWRRRDPLRGDDPAPATLLRRGPRVWVVGGSGDRILVTALNLDGTLRWREVAEPADDVVAERLDVGVVDFFRLFVAGTRSRGPGAPAPMVARRYDVGDRVDNIEPGSLAWEAELGDGAFRARDIAVTSVGPVVVVGETIRPETGLPRWTVHALDAETGEVMWSDMPFPARRAASTAAAVHVRFPVVTVVGSVSRARRVPVIRSYDLTSGEIRWSRRGAGVRRGSFQDVTFRLFTGALVVGSGRLGGGRPNRALVQVFDFDDGTLLDTRLGATGPDGAVLNTLAKGAPRLLVTGGRIDGPGGASAGLLHTYRTPIRATRR